MLDQLKQPKRIDPVQAAGVRVRVRVRGQD